MASKPRPFLKVEPLRELSLARLLSADEYLAYHVLRLQSWVEEPAGTLPDCPLELARYSGLSAERWEAVSQRVLAYFPEWNPGRRYHKETRALYEEMCRIANERSEAGRKGGSVPKQTKANGKQTEANAKQLLPTQTKDLDIDQDKDSSSSREADEAAADQLGDNIRLLMSIGMGVGDSSRWAKHPNATPERVRFLVAKAASGAWEGRAVAMVCAGIRDGWDVPAAEADTVKAKAARILAGSQKARKAAS